MTGGKFINKRPRGFGALLGHLADWNKVRIMPNSHVATRYMAEVTNPNFDI